MCAYTSQIVNLINCSELINFEERTEWQVTRCIYVFRTINWLEQRTVEHCEATAKHTLAHNSHHIHWINKPKGEVRIINLQTKPKCSIKTEYIPFTRSLNKMHTQYAYIHTHTVSVCCHCDADYSVNEYKFNYVDVKLIEWNLATICMPYSFDESFTKFTTSSDDSPSIGIVCIIIKRN